MHFLIKSFTIFLILPFLIFQFFEFFFMGPGSSARRGVRGSRCSVPKRVTPHDTTGQVK